jgi:hypothetical protein
MYRGYYVIGIYTLVAVSLIFIYGKIRCEYKGFSDPLQFNLPIWDLDGWSLTHFLGFALVGFMRPQDVKITMAYGVAWELFEFYYGHFKPGFLANWGHCVTTDSPANGSIWWYGKMSDLVMNGSGLLFGQYLATIYNKYS